MTAVIYINYEPVFVEYDYHKDWGTYETPRCDSITLISWESEAREELEEMYPDIEDRIIEAIYEFELNK